jgi:hypothetical protein
VQEEAWTWTSLISEDLDDGIVNILTDRLDEMQIETDYEISDDDSVEE